MASLDLLYGSGGKATRRTLRARSRSCKEDLEGTSPKFDVTDAQGVEWKVKLGEEAP